MMTDGVAINRLTSGMIWLSAGSIAIAVHLVLVQQGVAALRFSTEPAPPPKTLEIDVSSVPRGVAAKHEIDRPKLSEAVRPEAIRPVDQTKAVATTTAAVVAVSPTSRSSVSASTTIKAIAPTSIVVVQTALPSAKRVTGQNPIVVTSTHLGPKPEPSMAVTPNLTKSMVVSTVPNHAKSVVATPSVATNIAPRASKTENYRVAPIVSGSSSVAPTVVAPGKRVVTAAPTTPTSLAPVATVVEQTGVTAPDIPVIAATEQDAVAYQSVLDVLATTASGACFAALPTISDTGEFQLEVFSRTNDDLETFSQSFSEKTGAVPNTNLKRVSDAQCAALTYLRDSPVYPRFKLYFEIARRDILSGESLTGRIGNTGGGFLTLLVVDDEGKVQDLASYLEFVPGGAKFSIALSVTGSPVKTQQLLVAISTRASVATVQERNGANAADFFEYLTTELREKGEAEDAAVVAFTVR